MSAAYCALRTSGVCWARLTPPSRARQRCTPPPQFAVPLGEVVVGGDEVYALALERVEVDGQGRDQRLALAGLHLRDAPEMQCDDGHQLTLKVPAAERR